MAMFITEDCIACNACAVDCPNDAITVADVYLIDPERCTECVGWNDSPQCVATCPVDCVIPDPNRVETHEELLAKYERNVRASAVR